MRLGRVLFGELTVCLILAALALAQGNGQDLAPVDTSIATVPRLIQMRGAVRDTGGKPLGGSLGITFTLYKDQFSQEPVWQETQNLQLDSAGRYSVLLGATNDGGLPLEIFSAGEARWLGIRPDGQAEQPRILLLSVAYALKAADAEMLGGKPASAYVLAGSQHSAAQAFSGTLAGGANSPSGPQILNWSPGAAPLLTPPPSCASLTSDGTATANQVAKFTTACNLENSAIFESGGNVGIGNTSPAGMLDVSGTALVRGSLNALGGIVVAPTGTATTAQGFVSNPLDIEASLYNTTLGRAANYIWQWQAEPVGNNSASTSSTLNLLYGVAGSISETGLSVNNKGILSFAAGQTFPGAGTGTVTSVGTGAGLTGGPITGSGTISIPAAGVTNSMLANPSITVTAGSGLSGGGTVALGGTVTITNSSPGLGGTVTSVGSGAGLTGGPITSSGTLSLNTSFTDARYLQLSGGTLTGALSGTAANFNSGTFSGTLSAAGALLPKTGSATAAQGFNSNPLDLQASAFNSANSAAVAQDFRWQAEPTGNDSSNPSGSLNLLFGSGGNSPAETGLSIASNGLINFASGQTFPGAGGGTVTSVATGAGLTGGPITKTGTISIPAAGVTNSMLANPSITVTAGSGLSGGGTVALGGTVTITNSSPGLGGTVTSVGTGSGILGGPITSSGTLTLDTSFTDARYLQLAGGTLTGALKGTAATFTGALGASNGTFSGTLTAQGAVLPKTGTATATQGFISNPLDLQASSFSSTSSSAVTQDFRWQTEPTGNDSASPSGSLNLLFGSGGNAPTETGFSIASNGLLTFAPGQTFPGGSGGGTVTSVGTGAGLTGGPITSSGTISIPSGGVLNSMLANSTITVQAGSGLSGGGTVALGGTVTLTNTASGGTVTSVSTGAGLTGGPITTTGTISIPTGGVLNSMLANPSITVQAGPGLSGGGSVALGGTVTLASNLSGTTDGIAYFSSPSNVVSTPAPTNGQILIGSTGNAPVLGTLTAGPNVTITNGPGSVTISAAGGGGSTTLPFFVTGGERTGGTQAVTANVNKLWGFLLPYNVTTTQITYDVTTADNTANNYDIGIFNNSGNIVVDLGPTPGTTLAAAKGFQTLSWVQGATALPAGRYYLAITTNCSKTCAVFAAGTTYVSYAVSAPAGASQGGALPASLTPPGDAWNAGNQPTVVIH